MNKWASNGESKMRRNVNYNAQLLIGLVACGGGMGGPIFSTFGPACF